MKGIILAGGTGSRLYPLSKVTNKHLLPVGRYPMIYYPIFKLKQAGIEDIFIVTGKEHAGAIVNCDIFEGWWTDAGTFESLTYANMLVEGYFIDMKATVGVRA